MEGTDFFFRLKLGQEIIGGIQILQFVHVQVLLILDLVVTKCFKEYFLNIT